MRPKGATFDALVVLGCRVHPGGMRGALLRRLERARVAAVHAPPKVVVFSGGKVWSGTSEAQAMRSWWEQKVPHFAGTELVSEELSEDTFENSERTSELLLARDITRIGLVTCDYHMRRATLLFEETGLLVTPLPAPKARTWAERVRLAFQERGALLLVREKRKRRR